MKTKIIILIFYFFLSSNYILAQQTGFQRNFGEPAPYGNSSSGVLPGTGSSSQGNGSQNRQQTTGSGENSNTESPSNQFPAYNPSTDNHLSAPENKESSGLFGYPISEVEQFLKNAGARNYSYAFGKHSRMVISKYMLLLNFDKNKRLGSVTITAISPYKHVPPVAKEYFMNLFLGNSDLSSYSVKISSTELSISYKNFSSEKTK